MQHIIAIGTNCAYAMTANSSWNATPKKKQSSIKSRVHLFLRNVTAVQATNVLVTTTAFCWLPLYACSAVVPATTLLLSYKKPNPLQYTAVTEALATALVCKVALFCIGRAIQVMFIYTTTVAAIYGATNYIPGYFGQPPTLSSTSKSPASSKRKPRAKKVKETLPKLPPTPESTRPLELLRRLGTGQAPLTPRFLRSLSEPSSSCRREDL